MCACGFKETTDRSVNLKEESPLRVVQMIMWLYHVDYPVDRTATLSKLPDLSLEKILKAGLRLDDDDEEADEAIQPLLPYPYWSNVEMREVESHVEIYSMADKYGIEELGKHSINKVFNCVRGRKHQPHLDGSWLHEVNRDGHQSRARLVAR